MEQHHFRGLNMKINLTNFLKWGNDITTNLRERRFSTFKSEKRLFKAWSELWKYSSMDQKPGGPVIVKISPEQMKWIPYVYLYSYRLSYNLDKTWPKLDFFCNQRKKQKKFADLLQGYSEILKELLFTEKTDLKNFLFSDDIIQNGGTTILRTRIEFNKLMESVSEGHYSSLSGIGDDVQSFTVTGTGMRIFMMSHDGTRNFAVVLKDQSGNWVALIVNEIGSYLGKKFEQFTTGTYYLDITADGSWTIDISLL
jgi:hypothetical protein